MAFLKPGSPVVVGTSDWQRGGKAGCESELGAAVVAARCGVVGEDVGSGDGSVWKKAAWLRRWEIWWLIL